MLPLVTEVLNRTIKRNEESVSTRLFYIMKRSIRVASTGRQAFAIVRFTALPTNNELALPKRMLLKPIALATFLGPLADTCEVLHS